MELFNDDIQLYEEARKEYEQVIGKRMALEDLRTMHEVLFSAHSCAIEGNSFTVGDTQELKEKGLGVIPHGKTLFEAFEILDHFKAYEFLLSDTSRPLTEELLKDTHRILMTNTLSYRVPRATPGEYTTTDMCAGDTLFGDHEELIARLPMLLNSTQKAIDEAQQHPMVVAARFHGYYEYLHPFRDGNGRLGRLMSNYILLKMGYPMMVIEAGERQEYLDALRMIRKENTDEFLIHFFFKVATQHMLEEVKKHTSATAKQKKLMFMF